MKIQVIGGIEYVAKATDLEEHTARLGVYN
jgi:hypothetical protein